MITEILVVSSWREPLDIYLRFLVASGKPASTIYKRGYHVRRFAATTQLDPWAVTFDDLVTYLAHNPKWGPSTRRSHSSALRAFYRWAYLTKRQLDDPTEGLPVIPVPKGRPRPAPESAVTIGLSNIDRRVRLMIKLGAQEGLRCCEIAVVHRRDIVEDLVGHSLLVHGKGAKTRLVALNHALASELRALPDGYVFTGQVGGHISAGYVSKLISRALPGGVTAHRLRHRLASQVFIGTGGDLLAVRDILGHASVATTEIYTATPQHSARRGIDFAAAS